MTSLTNDFKGPVSAGNSGSNALQLTDINAIQLGKVTTSNNLTVNAGSDITQSGVLAVGGTSTFSAASGRSIQLSGLDNNLQGRVTIDSVGGGTLLDVGLRNVNTLATLSMPPGLQLRNLDLQFTTAPVRVPTLAVSGTLNVLAGGAITQAPGGVQVGGASTFNSGANTITLVDPNNDFIGAVSANNSGGANAIELRDANAIQLGTVKTDDKLTVTAALGITQDTGGVKVGGASTFNGGAGPITLNIAPTNDFIGAVSANNSGANAIRLSDTNEIQLGTVKTDDKLSVTAALGITQDTGGVKVGGASTFNGGAGPITLNIAPTNDFIGAVSANNSGANAIRLSDTNEIQLGTVKTDDKLTVTAALGITQDTGGVKVGGTSTFNGGAGPITLNIAPTNDFIGAVSANNSGANAIRLSDANEIQLGTVKTDDKLTVTAALGITQDTGGVKVGGASTFNGGAGPITLNIAPTNDFIGAVSANNSGANAIRLSDTNEIQLGTVKTDDNLTVTAALGITQDTGGVKVGGASTFNGGAGPITLNIAPTNDFIGAVSANNSGANAIRLSDTNEIQLGTVKTDDKLTVTAALGITQDTGGVKVGGASTFNGGAGPITLNIAPTNDFIGAVSANNSGANAIRLSDTNEIQLGTVKTDDKLTVTAALGITQDTGGVKVGGASTFNGGAGPITLNIAPTNDFIGAVSANNSGANAIRLSDTNEIQLGTVKTDDKLTVTAALGITQDTGGVKVGGTSTFNGGAGPITLNIAPTNDFIGAVSANNSGANAIRLSDANEIQLGTVKTDDKLSVTAALGITQDTGGVKVGGASTFNGGAGPITLNIAPDNDFIGAVSANNSGGANAIELRDANAIQLGTLTTQHNLTVTARDDITQSGTLTVRDASTFTIDTATDRSVLLAVPNVDNNLQGSVTINAVNGGTLLDVGLRNVADEAGATLSALPGTLRNLDLQFTKSALVLPTTNLSGRVNLVAGGPVTIGDLSVGTGGAITSSDVLTIAGALMLDAGTLLLTSTLTPPVGSAGKLTDPEFSSLTLRFRDALLQENIATIKQAGQSVITTKSGTLLAVRSPGYGSILLEQQGNAISGDLSAVSGSLGDNDASRFYVNGNLALGVVRINSSTVNVAGRPSAAAGPSLLEAGIEADVVRLKADTVSTGQGGLIRARLPFENLQGSRTSLPGLRFELTTRRPTPFPNPYGSPGLTAFDTVKVGDQRRRLPHRQAEEATDLLTPTHSSYLGGDPRPRPFYDGSGSK